MNTYRKNWKKEITCTPQYVFAATDRKSNTANDSVAFWQ